MNRLVAAALLSTVVLASPLAAKDSPEEVAAKALEAAPVWDGHNDVPIQLRGRFGNVIGDFDFADTLDTKTESEDAMQTDLARLRKGKVGAQFWSVYVSARASEPELAAMSRLVTSICSMVVCTATGSLSEALT